MATLSAQQNYTYSSPCVLVPDAHFTPSLPTAWRVDRRPQTHRRPAAVLAAPHQTADAPHSKEAVKYLPLPVLLRLPHHCHLRRRYALAPARVAIAAPAMSQHPAISRHPATTGRCRDGCRIAGRSRPRCSACRRLPAAAGAAAPTAAAFLQFLCRWRQPPPPQQPPPRHWQAVTAGHTARRLANRRLLAARHCTICFCTSARLQTEASDLGHGKP